MSATSTPTTTPTPATSPSPEFKNEVHSIVDSRVYHVSIDKSYTYYYLFEFPETHQDPKC